MPPDERTVLLSPEHVYLLGVASARFEALTQRLGSVERILERMQSRLFYTLVTLGGVVLAQVLPHIGQLITAAEAHL